MSSHIRIHRPTALIRCCKYYELAGQAYSQEDQIGVAYVSVR